MRRWLRAAGSAASVVADRPSLWVIGALAWTVSSGWLALVIGVARLPSVGELTFFGAGLFTSGAWPWNVVAIGVAGLCLLLLGFVLAAAAEVALLRGSGARPVDVLRVAALGLVVAAPTLIFVLALAIGVAAVAPGEFNAPGESSGPLLRTVVRLAPLVAATVLVAVAGAAVHAAAARRVLRGSGLAAALAGGPSAVGRAGAPAVLHVLVMLVVRVAYVALAAAGLRVLWAPIAERLAADGMDVATALLLVGFVAIWLCLILGGGALHAWGSATWTRVLDARTTNRGPSSDRMETRTGS